MTEKAFRVVVCLFVILLAAAAQNSASGRSATGGSNPVISEMISKISDAGIYHTIYDLQNFTTREYGTGGNSNACKYLHDRLANISGLSVSYESGSYNDIVATLPGKHPISDSFYMVGAHYDDYSSTPGNAPGATDNGAGVGIVLEMARVMSQYGFNETIKFAFWNGEELGDLGSMSYVQAAHTNKVNISLYMNYDATGYDPNGNLTLDLMYNTKSAWVRDIETEHNALYGIGFNLTCNQKTGSSDYESFWLAGYTAVSSHQQTNGNQYHTEYDTIEKVSLTYAKKNCQLGMSVMARLAWSPVLVGELSFVIVPIMFICAVALFLYIRERRQWRRRII